MRTRMGAVTCSLTIICCASAMKSDESALFLIDRLTNDNQVCISEYRKFSRQYITDGLEVWPLAASQGSPTNKAYFSKEDLLDDLFRNGLVQGLHPHSSRRAAAVKEAQQLRLGFWKEEASISELPPEQDQSSIGKWIQATVSAWGGYGTLISSCVMFGLLLFSGINWSRRKIPTFLVVGPSGVGKTAVLMGLAGHGGASKTTQSTWENVLLLPAPHAMGFTKRATGGFVVDTPETRLPDRLKALSSRRKAWKMIKELIRQLDYGFFPDLLKMYSETCLVFVFSLSNSDQFLGADERNRFIGQQLQFVKDFPREPGPRRYRRVFVVFTKADLLDATEVNSQGYSAANWPNNMLDKFQSVFSEHLQLIISKFSVDGLPPLEPCTCLAGDNFRSLVVSQAFEGRPGTILEAVNTN